MVYFMVTALGQISKQQSFTRENSVLASAKAWANFATRNRVSATLAFLQTMFMMAKDSSSKAMAVSIMAILKMHKNVVLVSMFHKKKRTLASFAKISMMDRAH